MNIFFIKRVKFLVLNKWSYRFPPIILTNEVGEANVDTSSFVDSFNRRI